MADVKIITDILKCPNCGCPDTVNRAAAAPYKEDGRIPKDAYVAHSVTNKMIVPPTKVSLSVPTLFIYMDICLDCGILYATRAEQRDVPIKYQMAGGGGPPRGAGFG
ncbi:hypothetical protein LCGC14_1963360 [marine sediment metagenome]|uniref:Uncharacterized protein n=1 Tax=marine sediment metagenome TaxID=412755 RepID=A0A0F9FDU7_9ZZZZ